MESILDSAGPGGAGRAEETSTPVPPPRPPNSLDTRDVLAHPSPAIHSYQKLESPSFRVICPTTL